MRDGNLHGSTGSAMVNMAVLEPPGKSSTFPVHRRLRELAKAEGEEWDIDPDAQVIDRSRPGGSVAVPLWQILSDAIVATRKVDEAAALVLTRFRRGDLHVVSSG